VNLHTNEGADEPRLLIIETSGRVGLVAVASGAEVLAVRPLAEGRKQGRDLAPAVGELLRQQGWTARQLQGVLVSLGPGSYTGLRVGIISAKTLCYATGCALLGVETFAAIAEQAPAAVTSLDVLADAQQGKVYLQSFRRASAAAAWEPQSPLAIRTVEDWLAGRDAEAWVSGPGIDVHAGRLPSGVKLVEAELRLPQAESLLRIGLRRYRADKRDDGWSVEPIYLRPSAAEEQWRRLGRG
jgi:tRNA threonylcarbamoyladenosine biosynthesis protein TsaB